MSIANDVRSYADSALGQAQARLTEVRGDATELANSLLSRATTTCMELRSRGEALTKRAGALPGVERASASIEPYVALLKGYGTVAAGRLEQAYAELRKNDQVAKVIAAAGIPVDAVQGRVTSLLDRQPTATAPAPAPVTSPAKPTPAAKAQPATKAQATKPTPAGKAQRAAKTSAAKATPVKRTTTRRATDS
jgi:hypothetical protein